MDTDTNPKHVAAPLLPMFVPEDKTKPITDPKNKKLLSWLEDVTLIQKLEVIILIVVLLLLAIHIIDDLIFHFVYGV